MAPARTPLLLLAPLLLAPLLAACDRVSGGAEDWEVTEIRSPAAPGSGEPGLAVGEDGAAYLSWLEPGPDSAPRFRFSRLAGDRWSAPRTIASDPRLLVNWADFPSMAALPGGALAAHWLVRNGAGRYDYEVRISRSEDGGGSWSEPVVPHRDSGGGEHGFVSLWPEDGGVAAVWLDGRRYVGAAPGEGQTMLRHAIVDASGAAGAEMELDGRICDCCQTSAAVTARGPVVVYRDRSADEIRDIHVVRRVDGRWTPPAPVHDDGWRIEACPVNGPAVAALGDRVAVAWFTAARDTPTVKVAFSSDAGATFDAPLRVDGGDPAGRVGIELLDDGSAAVSWLEQTGESAAEVRLRRMSPDGPSGAAVVVARSSSGRASGFPVIARSGDELLLAWTRAGDPSTVAVARARRTGR